MYFQHSEQIWRDYPELVPGVLIADGISARADVDDAITRYYAIARSRLDGRAEGELPQIQAWRRTFAKMGLKPTQYRCASESLLRRFRKEGSLPRLHPLVDLCNAISLAFAIPVAVFDVAMIDGDLEVRNATESTPVRDPAWLGGCPNPPHSRRPARDPTSLKVHHWPHESQPAGGCAARCLTEP